MRTIKLIINLVVVMSSLMFFQCTSEYTPIPGPSGLDGIDGIDGIDGVDSTADCRACHSNEHRDPIEGAYLISAHAIGGTARFGDRGGEDPLNRCARCHGNEGFIDFVTFGESNEDGYSNATEISCTTCHDTHRSFDFENDGNDFALRVIDPVEILTDPGRTIDLGDHSNLCVNCHQPRNTSLPTDNGVGMFEITSSRFGPHHGPQSTVFEGTQLVLIAGSQNIPGIGTSAHRQLTSCIKCHMGETTDGTDGSHTWNPTLNACIQCHSDITSFDRNGVQTEVTSLLNELELLLVEAGIATGNGRAVTGEWSIDIVNAYWNWISVVEDQSKGIHNPDYIRAILKNSIESLQP